MAFPSNRSLGVLHQIEQDARLDTINSLVAVGAITVEQAGSLTKRVLNGDALNSPDVCRSRLLFKGTYEELVEKVQQRKEHAEKNKEEVGQVAR